jgi:hypothetical protein
VLEALLPLWPAVLPLLWSLLDGVDAAPAAAPDDWSLVLDELVEPTGCE